ncbi:MAG: hypothetical protein AAF721_03100 [Myxococcota bacterium]
MEFAVAACLLVVTACQDVTVPAGGSSDSGDDGGDTLQVTGDGQDEDTTGVVPPADSTDDGLDESSDGAVGSTGCVPVGESSGGLTECEDDCDASGFELEHISGVNYRGQRVHHLSPTCIGPTCPEPLQSGTFGPEPIVPCEETADALASPRGPEVHCQFAPLALTFGFELGFTQPPAADSITLTRPRIDDPSTVEDYLWRSRTVEMRGPGTEFNGHYVRGSSPTPDRVERVTNLSCLANLEARGLPFDPEDLATACAATFDEDGATVPLRRRAEVVFRPTEGRLDPRNVSCNTPDAGPDTCCNACDYELSVNVAKYGVAPTGVLRSPNTDNALACDPDADRLSTCRDFRPRVNRTGEVATYRYEWNGCTSDWRVPLYDRIRETHPDDRPGAVEPPGPLCNDGGDCAEGQECIGTNADGEACTAGAACAERRCQAQWFVECRSDPELIPAQPYCVDARFHDSAAGACHETTAPFQGVGGQQPAGSRLAQCDLDADGNYTNAECCQGSLGDEPACDPFFQAEVQALGRHDRDPSLPDAAQCVCSADVSQPATCDAVVQAWCEAPVGDATDPGAPSAAGGYALPSVTRQGGTRYDADLEGFELRFAHAGNLPRAKTEACAQARNLIGGRDAGGSWLAHDNAVASLDRDHDLAMCSGSTYEVVFAGPDDAEHIASEAGDTLAGRQRYVIETVDFLVSPGSGFPTDNLVISSCDSFSLRFTNKYDLSVDNLRKLAIWEVVDMAGEDVPTQRVAGGRDCDPDATAGDVAMGAIPCLVVDLEQFGAGAVEVAVDPSLGNLLQPGLRYRVVAPGLDSPADLTNAEAYAEAFHDACGMPLITGDLPESEYEYDFTIDQGC